MGDLVSLPAGAGRAPWRCPVCAGLLEAVMVNLQGNIFWECINLECGANYSTEEIQ